MPLAAARACTRLGCVHLQPCPEHPKGETYRERVTARPWASIYNTQRWRRLSERVRREEPLCRSCRASGRPPSPSRHVDHITPHRGPDDPMAFDRENLQALCATCHSTKTRQEQHR